MPKMIEMARKKDDLLTLREAIVYNLIGPSIEATANQVANNTATMLIALLVEQARHTDDIAGLLEHFIGPDWSVGDGHANHYKGFGDTDEVVDIEERYYFVKAEKKGTRT